jgi:hypothetical protein
MELTPQLPPLPTLTLSSTLLNDPPDKPPDPSISVLFPENTRYRVPDNPFRGPLSQKLKKEHRQALQEALGCIKEPFFFELEEPIRFEGANVGVDTSTENFNAAVITVIAAIERGYFSMRDPTPLGPTEWARLSCAVLAAVGRGYHRQYTTEQEGHLEKVRAEAIDPKPLTNNPTLFHRLSAIACNVSDHVGVDQEGYQDWYLTIKEEFTKKATKAAAAEVDEKWLLWKANQIDRLAHNHQQEIAARAREHGIDYFIETGQRLGLHITRSVNATIPTPTPTIGRKRSLSGSLSSAGPATPTMRMTVPPRGSTPSPAATPRGRPALPHALQRAKAPSPNPKVMPDPVQSAQTTNGNLSLDNIMAAIEAAVGPAIQSAMAPYAAKISALEKAARPPTQAVRAESRRNTTSLPKPNGIGASTWAPTELVQPSAAKLPADPPQRTDMEYDSFTPVTRKERGKKSNTMPASYAGAAAAVAKLTQPPAPPRQPVRLPTITEVTVIRSGGFVDPELEQNVRARAADAIVREVTLKMAKAVAKPVPLKAGRWSIHPRSKGNFVYSFDGNVPFDLISTYEHILLSPFRGSGKLSPSMGWTRLLAHGVPVWDDNGWTNFGPEALLEGVKAMPGLKRAHFAMPPRWLKPVDRIESEYSTITFAISDPDGTITSKLLTGRAALFGKEVIIQRWVDKPALVQCSHCHALGHIRSSRSCTLAKDSVKCHICGGAHPSDRHDQSCPRKHEVAGICDCKHFKCINCHKTGHTCKDSRCPARDLFRPRQSRGSKKSKGKGKERERPTAENPAAAPSSIAAALPNTTIEEILDTDGDLYDPPPLPPNPTGRQIRSALRDNSTADLLNHYDDSMEIDSGNNEVGSSTVYDTNKFPEALNGGPSKPTEVTNVTAQLIDYSPSRPQLGATNTSLD